MNKAMKKTLIITLYNISNLTNFIMKTKVNRFIYTFIIINILGATAEVLFSIDFLVISFVLSYLSASSFLRVSDNFILNKWTGTLNMNLRNLKEYRKYSYIQEKEKIKEKLKIDFIKGILKASRIKKTIRMRTHKWMIEEVLNSNEIKNNLKVIYTKKQKINLKTEILLLVSKKELIEKIKIFKKILKIKRTAYKVTIQNLTK